jgi:hypothetical protein
MLKICLSREIVAVRPAQTLFRLSFLLKRFNKMR